MPDQQYRICPACCQRLALHMLRCGRCGAAAYDQPAHSLRREAGGYVSTPTRGGSVPLAPGQAALSQQTGGCAAVVGFVLCLTGIGALLGLPMIWLGLREEAAARRGQMRVRTGDCPHCARPIWLAPGTLQADCPHCARSVVLREGRFWST